jgi:hypothetical protein
MKIGTRLFYIAVLSLAATVALFVFLSALIRTSHVVTVNVPVSSADVPEENDAFVSIPVTNGTTTPIAAFPETAPAVSPLKDIPPQPQLENPPNIIKAIYLTSWSAGSKKKMDAVIDLIKTTELNAVVIDIKDYSGYITYGTELPLVHEYKAYELRTPYINALLKRLHDEGIYAIARLSVFQDPRLALARPELALMSSTTGAQWKDNKGLMWVDPAAKAAWEYNVSIAREAFERGFDEVNFDYIRFASDGKLSDIIYPAWDGTTYKTAVIRDFWNYVRTELSGKRISGDLFGLTTVNHDGLGIGQHLEYGIGNFDAIAPMVYPSHYYPGFIGIAKPATEPYNVIKYSMDAAVKRFVAEQGTTTPAVTTLRPWLQDFDLGADYTADMIRAQIQAVYDATAEYPQFYSGWMLWNPSNVYTKAALEPAGVGN